MQNILPISPYFASNPEKLLALPHLFTALDAELVGKIAHLTKAQLGLWCVPAPFDEHEFYDRARVSAPFANWALPGNQAEVLSFSPLVQEAIFGTKLMLLDAVFDETILNAMAVVTGQRLETGAYVTRGFQDLPELPQLVEQCGWALIPVGPERCQALFIVRGSQADWIAKMQEWCEREGRNFGKLRQREGQIEIVDHAAPEKYRRNAIDHQIDGLLGHLEMLFGGIDPDIPQRVAERIQARRQLREDIARAEGPSSGE